MAWIKKNLGLVISGVVSVALLVYAVMYVRKQIEADKTVTEELDQAANQFQTLLQRKVLPGNERNNNIERAKAELDKMQAFLTNMQVYLTGPEIPKLNNRDFRVLLETSLARLQNDADRAGVPTPTTNYWFTFSDYKTAIDFRGDEVGLAAQLKDIEAIVAVLLQARVHSIVSMKRAPVSENDNRGTPDYIDNRMVKTNDWAVLSGYEVTFQGFSSELARVMEGLANAQQCFIVKSVAVVKAPEERKPAPAAAAPMMPMMNPMNPYAGAGMDRYRYGGGGMPAFRPPPPQPRPAAPRQGAALETVADESRLRFLLQLDSVRLKPKEQDTTTPGAAPANPTPTAAADNAAPGAPAAPAAPETTAAVPR